MQRPDRPDANDTFLADLEKDGFSHVALKKLDKKSLIKRLRHNQIVRGERIWGQSTEKPVIVEALDLTLRTIKKRIKRYRNLVISVLIVTGVSVSLAIFCRQWLFTAGLILLVPLIAAFSLADGRSVLRWRAHILEMASSRGLDLSLFVKTAWALRKASPKMLNDMLAMVPNIPPSEKEYHLTSDSIEVEQKRLERKTIVSTILLTVALAFVMATELSPECGSRSDHFWPRREMIL